MITTLPVMSDVGAVVARVLDIDNGLVVPDARFTDLGRTSLQEVELFAAVEKQFGVRLDFGSFADAKTVQELLDVITAAVGALGDS